jgi:nitroimidazol reductase NimA-like FMN-containing flavoprotein (pyridoxamine 5'-phosphate oxidase superfamily)
MEGYGVPATTAGILPWEWAQERLSKSHNYMVSTVRPDGAPHVMPVWGIWLSGAFYFSTAANSRKARNLAANPRCVVCNEQADEAVIVEGVARRMAESEIPREAFVDYKAKYEWELDPHRGSVIKVQPTVVFAMPEKQFPKGVTKWFFDASP